MLLYLFVALIFSFNPSTITTALSTTPASLASSLWSFDGNTLDSLSTRHGVASQPASYTTDVFDSSGRALTFSKASEQYVRVDTYQNLSYQSFTIEMWFYCTDLTYGRYGLFGQKDNLEALRSLHLQIRDFAPYFGFFDDDLSPERYIKQSIWYYIAFVYDFQNRIQSIYLNGQQIGSRSAQPYQGTSGPITIGRTDEQHDRSSYFDGYIDEVSLVMRAKSVAEIEDSALAHLGPDRLVSWHSFDNDSLIDRARIPLRAVVGSVAYIAGRVNQAIRFSSSASYYQIQGFRLLGQSNFPYSMSLWVKPSSISGATLIHSSTEPDGTGWCVDFLGFSSAGNIVTTVWEGPYSQEVIGPIVQLNNWTHIAATYSKRNGGRLFVNGLMVGTTGSQTYEGSESLNILTLGNSIQGKPQSSPGGSCNSQSIDPRVYYGVIDEFRVYAKELSAIEVWNLANL